MVTYIYYKNVYKHLQVLTLICGYVRIFWTKRRKRPFFTPLAFAPSIGKFLYLFHVLPTKTCSTFVKFMHKRLVSLCLFSVVHLYLCLPDRCGQKIHKSKGDRQCKIGQKENVCLFCSYVFSVRAGQVDKGINQPPESLELKMSQMLTVGHRGAGCSWGRPYTD